MNAHDILRQQIEYIETCHKQAMAQLQFAQSAIRQLSETLHQQAVQSQENHSEREG